MRRWKAHRGKIASLSFSRDGHYLASVTGSGRDIFIWDATAGELVRKLTAEGMGSSPVASERVTGISFAPSADRMVILRNGGIELWRTRTWERVLRVATDCNYDVACGPGPDPWIACSGAGEVQPFKMKAPAILSCDGLWKCWRKCRLSFSTTGTLLATHNGRAVEVRNPATGQVICHLKLEIADDTGPIRFSPDSTRLAFGFGKQVESHPATLDDPDAVIRYAGHTDKVWALRYTPDGRTLISASGDGTVRLWEASTGLEKRCFDMKIGKIAAADVSPDGAVAAVGGANGEIVVWDLE